MKSNSLKDLATLKVEEPKTPKVTKVKAPLPPVPPDYGFKWHHTGTPPLHLQVVICYCRRDDGVKGTALSTLTASGWVDSYGVHWPILSHPIYGWHFVYELPPPEVPNNFKSL